MTIALLLQTVASFAAYLNLPSDRPSNLTYIAKKCKELAVVLLNSGRSSTAASDFFNSITTLLGQHQHLQNPIFLIACACSAVQVAETAQARGIWVWEQASQLVQGLCDRLRSSWSKLDAFTAVNIFQTLAKCHLQHGPMPPEYLDAAAAQISAKRKGLSQQGVSLAAWACASVYQRSDPTRYHPLLDQLTAQAMREPSGSFTLQHAATIIWSMSRSHYHPTEALLLKLTWSACFQLGKGPSHAAQDLQMLLLGCAWLGFTPPSQAMAILVGHIMQQPLKGHQASNMAWSLAVLGQVDLSVFDRLLSHVSRSHLQDPKISRQLHYALDYLQPETDCDPEFDDWQQVSEQLHEFWPFQPFINRTRLIHDEVLSTLEEGLGLQCRKDVSISRDHDHSLFSMDILIEQQSGVPHDIAVQVDGPDSFFHNKEADKR